MLTPEQIAALRDAAGQITDPINDYLLEDVARRISEAGQLTSTAAYEAWRAQQLGMSQREIKKRLRKLLNVSHRDLRRLLAQSAEVGYDFDIKHLPYVQSVPFEQNAVMQQIVSAAAQLAREDFTNITQTLGMIDPFGNALPLQDAYRSCMDYAFKQMSTGATDYTTAIRQACKNLSGKGVQWIDYKSGVHTSLEAAVRRSVMGGLGLMQEQITQQNHDDLGCDGWEISAHAASAPDHEPIQGLQYSDAEYTALNNSLVRRIGTLNCGHAAFPIILGVSTPQYTPEELQKFRADNAAGIDDQGKHYTLYEATQMQRKVERAMRTQKRRILTDEATGDQEKLQTDQIRLVRLREEYARFSKAAGLRTQQERAEVAGFGPKRAEMVGKAVEIAPKRAIIGSIKPISEDVAVHHVTRLDVEKYKCVSDKIATDEVIITDERIQHIRDRHPNDFERYERYLSQIVENPDYILEANKPNTAFLLKEITDSDEHFQLILRLAVHGDKGGYKNSVITFLKVEEKRYKRYLRTRNILYKSE